MHRQGNLHPFLWFNRRKRRERRDWLKCRNLSRDERRAGSLIHFCVNSLGPFSSKKNYLANKAGDWKIARIVQASPGQNPKLEAEFAVRCRAGDLKNPIMKATTLKRISVIPLLAFLGACASDEVQPVNPEVMQKLQAIDRTRYGVISIYRPDLSMGRGRRPTVTLDGKDFVDIGNGEVFVAAIKPGSYTIEMDNKESGTQVSIKAGDEVYLKVDMVQGAWSASGRMTQVVPSQGDYEAPRLDLISPRHINLPEYVQDSAPAPATSQTTQPRTGLISAVAVASSPTTTRSGNGFLSANAVDSPTAATPDEAEKLLEAPITDTADGLYKLDGDNNINVLDSVYFDKASGKLALIGHHDARFDSLKIPYLQHLAALLKSPNPEFSLTWSPDSNERVDALLNGHLTEAEGEHITDQWGKLFDEAGQVTEAGRLLLPAFDVSPIEGNRAPGALGVEVTQLQNSTAVQITSVVPGSPADQAGLKTGDLITRFQGFAAFTPEIFYKMVRLSGAGSAVNFLYIHNNNGQLATYSGRATLTASTDPDVWKGTASADVVRALYMANGDQQAANVMTVAAIMQQLSGAAANPQAGQEVRGLMVDTLNVRDAVNIDIQASDSGSMSQVDAFYDIDSKECQAFDQLLHFPGSPVYNSFVQSYKSIGGDPYNSMQVAMQEMGRQLVPKLEALLDPVFTRPQGLQIPPELVEEQFHVHPEMVPEYRGIPADSLLARTMFAADYLGKRMENRPDLDRKINGYQTAFEFETKNPQFRHTSGKYRMWISVDKMDTPVSASGSTMEFRDARLRFNIREQTPDSTSEDGTDLPAKPGDYEELLTSLWDDLELEYPTLHEAREVVKVDAAADWMLQQDPAITLPEDGLTHWHGPAKVPGLIYVEMTPDSAQGIYKTHDIFIAEGGLNAKAHPKPGINSPNATASANPFPTDSSVVDLRDSPANNQVLTRPAAALVRSPANADASNPSAVKAGWVSTVAGGANPQQAIVLDINPNGGAGWGSVDKTGGALNSPVVHPNLTDEKKPVNVDGTDANAGKQLNSIEKNDQTLKNPGSGEAASVNARKGFDNGDLNNAGAVDASSVQAPPTKPEEIQIPLNMLGDPTVIKLVEYKKQATQLHDDATAAESKLQDAQKQNASPDQVTMLQVEVKEARDKAASMDNMVKVQTEEVKRKIKFSKIDAGGDDNSGANPGAAPAAPATPDASGTQTTQPAAPTSPPAAGGAQPAAAAAAPGAQPAAQPAVQTPSESSGSASQKQP
jgi:hypothetical protein